MPITTFRSLNAIAQTTDPDIVDALANLKQPPVVEEIVVPAPRRHWWTHQRLQTLYSVLWTLSDTILGPEWQVINFHREPPHTSLNTAVPKELVLAYLYGCSAAQHQEEPP